MALHLLYSSIFISLLTTMLTAATSTVMAITTSASAPPPPPLTFECPYESSHKFRQLWRNHSTTAFDGNRLHFDSYLCHFASYQHLKQISQPIERQLIILFSTFGFLGGLLTILTLNQKRFRILDFQLYRAIGYLEMVQMADLAIMDLLAYMKCELSYACTFVWAHIGFVIMNVCADAIDLLVLFLCVERTVACLLPHHFQRLHTRKCYIWAMITSILVPTFFVSFQAFELRVEYNQEEQRYKDEPSEFAGSDFYQKITQINTARFYMMAILIMTTTAFSIWGFYQVARRRRNLSRDYGGNTQTCRPIIVGSTSNLTTTGAQLENSSYALGGSSTVLNEQRQCLRPSPSHHSHRISRNAPTSGSASSSTRRVKKREMELCCLQLCLAVPIIINQILYASGLNMNYGFVYGESALKRNLTYEKATREMENVVDFYYLRMATNLTNVLAHALHFYLYLLFSVQVRHGFRMLVRSWRAKLQPSYGASSTGGGTGVLETHMTVMSMGNEISLA